MPHLDSMLYVIHKTSQNNINQRQRVIFDFRPIASVLSPKIDMFMTIECQVNQNLQRIYYSV